MSDPRTLHCHSVAGADLTWGRVAAGPLSRGQPGKKRVYLLIKVLMVVFVRTYIIRG